MDAYTWTVPEPVTFMAVGAGLLLIAAAFCLGWWSCKHDGDHPDANSLVVLIVLIAALGSVLLVGGLGWLISEAFVVVSP